MLKTDPAVFAVGREYRISALVNCESLVSVRIGEEYYYDNTCGVMNSLFESHSVSVPMDVLDTSGAYTVCVRPIKSRKPYFTETDDVEEYSYSFYPVPASNARAYHISDAHGKVAEPICAAKTFGNVDFLILNGDLLNHSDDKSDFINIYEICAGITRGEKPVVFSRGNHDMRGKYAELLHLYTPTYHGRTYYTFRLGSIWGVILDCCEDKDDMNVEYGFTVACKAYRRSQTEFLKGIVNNSESEFSAENVRTRLVISHKPFCEVTKPPFDIETDVYSTWAELLKNVSPHLMIHGHTHSPELRPASHARDTLGQPCCAVIASGTDNGYFSGYGFVFGDDCIKCILTDSEGRVLSTDTVYKV